MTTDSSMPPNLENLGAAREPKPRERLQAARRLVIKLGTNVLSRDTGELAIGRVYSLIEEAVDAHRRGKEIILVSSGAISLGMDCLGLKERPETLSDKQACAAIGQIRLMAVYQQALDRFGIRAAQVLLTEEDFTNRRRYLNLRNTFLRLLQFKAIPIVNENDTVSTSEIETHLDDQDRSVVFGDNDMLSALVASKLGADLLIILSDVNGLYDADPDSHPEAKHIPLVEDLTPEIEQLAQDGSVRGRGGMRTKLQAAKVATRSGTMTLIALGSSPGILSRIFAGEEIGTLFLPKKPLSSRKRWIAFATSAAGKVRVNAGAREALVHRRASLLFAGVVALENSFDSGDIVSILDEHGQEFARGMVNCSRAEAQKFLGRKSAEISALSPDAPAPGEFIHRDNIVILE